MNDSGQSIIVEAMLSGVKATGLMKNVSENRRLVDILNNQDLTFELQTVDARLRDDTRQRFPTLLIRKSDLQYAIPRESSEQIRRRALYRTGLNSASGSRTSLGVFLDGCSILGSVLLPLGMNPARLEIAAFSPFFAIADAVITRDGTATNEPVVIVRRDALMALGLPEVA